MLDTVRKAGVSVMVVTARYVAHARLICDHFGITELTDGVFGSGDPRKDKGKADVIRRILEEQRPLRPVIMVGDRAADVKAAAVNGLDTIGVLYGYGSREELEEAGAVMIAETAEELAGILTEEMPL